LHALLGITAMKGSVRASLVDREAKCDAETIRETWDAIPHREPQTPEQEREIKKLVAQLVGEQASGYK
jgi:hypothetical protein